MTEVILIGLFADGTFVDFWDCHLDGGLVVELGLRLGLGLGVCNFGVLGFASL